MDLKEPKVKQVLEAPLGQKEILEHTVLMGLMESKDQPEDTATKVTKELVVSQARRVILELKVQWVMKALRVKMGLQELPALVDQEVQREMLAPRVTLEPKAQLASAVIADLRVMLAPKEIPAKLVLWELGAIGVPRASLVHPELRVPQANMVIEALREMLGQRDTLVQPVL